MARPKFKISTFGPKPLSWWRSNKNKVDWDPPYQRRGRLWSSTDKAYLIDSILNEYDIPKIYLADFTWGSSSLNRKNLPYAIIDGKQRFEAIFDFFEGKLVLNDDFVYEDDPSLGIASLGYSDLRKNYPELAEKFETSHVDVMGVFAEDEEKINELFVRLNRSKSLTGAEIRNAMLGPAPEIARNIAHHEFFINNIRFTVSRGQDLNAVHKIMLFEYHGKLTETKRRNLDGFVRDTRDQKEKIELAGRRVIDVLDSMSEIFLPHDHLLSSGGIFPVYYWFVREMLKTKYNHVREFLVKFEKQRIENRGLSQRDTGSNQIDKELLEYDNLNRSTNDLRSHQGRFSILVRRFRTAVK
jgi:hypothetical protein